MTYELIGTPRVEPGYSDEWETTMVCDVRRSDGKTGDVWLVAGVPDGWRGSSEAAIAACETVTLALHRAAYELRGA